MIGESAQEERRRGCVCEEGEGVQRGRREGGGTKRGVGSGMYDKREHVKGKKGRKWRRRRRHAAPGQTTRQDVHPTVQSEINVQGAIVGGREGGVGGRRNRRVPHCLVRCDWRRGEGHPIGWSPFFCCKNMAHHTYQTRKESGRVGGGKKGRKGRKEGSEGRK